MVVLALSRTRRPVRTVPRVPTVPTIPREGAQPVMIIQNYNDEGGFFWQIYNILNMLYAAEKYGFQPVVIFDTGLYFEKRPTFTKEIPCYDKKNWFNHFFHPLNASPKDEQAWHEYVAKHRTIKRLDVHAMQQKKVPAVSIFDRTGLDSISQDPSRIGHFTRLFRTYIKPREHIQHKVLEFKKRNKWAGTFMIGLHFRGTDKFASKSGSEDNPVHFKYEFCEELVRKYLADHPGLGPVRIFVASDEEPFISFMSEKFPGLVCATTSIRAAVSTSGLFLDTSRCDRGVRDSKECRRYNDLIEQSIHRGMTDKSNYTKGEDVLLDVLLLSECNVFFRSRGNVSNFIGYINPACEVIDMVTEYHHNHTRV